MRQTSFHILAVAIVAAGAIAAASPARADDLSVYLLGGQSNMAGHGISDELADPLQTPLANVLLYKAGSLNTLAPSGVNFGPEIAFGHALADADPGGSYALIKYGVGGTGLLSHWKPPSGTAYTTFRNTVTDGIAAMQAAGHTVTIAGMLWVQGEKDARDGRTEAQYTADLTAFIADMRSNYGDDLPFIFSRLSSSQTDLPASGLDAIRAAQAAVAAADPLAFMIDTDGFGLKTDDLHFDTAGQLALGAALAGATLDAVHMPTPTASMSGLMALAWLAASRRRRT